MSSESKSDLDAATRLPDVVARSLTAFAVAGLAICARQWALNGALADEEAHLALPVASIVGLSALLAWMPAPLLVRVACHLTAVWIARETLGQFWHAATSLGIFLAASSAFFGTLAVRSLDSQGQDEQGGETERPLRWTTGDLLALLFVAGVYGAIARQGFASFGPATLEALRIAMLHALVPFAALGVATRLAGRLAGSVAICVMAVAIAIAFPVAAPCDPFAVAMIVALSALADRRRAPREANATGPAPAI